MWYRELQLLKEVISLVIHHDERREIDDFDFSNRLHPQLFEIDQLDFLDVGLGEDRRRAADAA